MKDAKIRITNIYLMEKAHATLYSIVGAREKNPAHKKMFNNLEKFEIEHVKLWEEVLEKREPIKLKVYLLLFLFKFIRITLGISMAIKLLEHNEIGAYTQLETIDTKKLNVNTINILKKIRYDQKVHEEKFENTFIKKSKVIRNIRDVTFGMNDGLVEVLAATVGLGAALQTPILVLIGGIIIAVSGTLSMAGGAYISTEYESNVDGIKRKSKARPAGSALYVGIPYFIGALVPLIPFILGYSGIFAIFSSIVLTAIVLIIIASLIALITDTSIKRKIGMTLAISLGAAAATIILGYAARSLLKISV